MFTISWLRDAVERSLRSAAQAVILALGASQGFDLFTADFANIAGLATGAAVLAFLTAVVGAPFGSKGSASFLPGK